jgi:hypothetical protein
MKHECIRFGKKVFIVAGILVVLDILAGKLFDHFYFRSTSGESAQTTYAVTTAAEDCQVFGSSRAVHHYVPGIIEERFSYSCYNAGKDGQGILYQYAVLKSILLRKAPRVILLDVDADEFRQNEAAYGRLSALLPYYYSHQEVQPVVNERSRYEQIKALSGLYRYNSLLLNTVSNVFKQENDGMEKGYKPLQKQWNKALAAAKKMRKESIDSIKINYFRQFLGDAKKAGSTVVVLVSPVFEKETTPVVSLEIAKSICEELRVPFINSRQEAQFISQPAYFADIDHLNEQGARAYTGYICNEIRKRRLVE